MLAAKWACVSFPITYLITYLGEEAFQIPFVILLVAALPGMLLSDFLNAQELNGKLFHLVIYVTQYLYYFVLSSIAMRISSIIRSRENMDASS